MTDYNENFNDKSTWKHIPPMDIPEEAELPLDEPFKEIQTFDLLEMGDQVGNVYKMVVILGERADDINTEYANKLKMALETYRNENQPVNTLSDYEERPKQEELVKKFERMPKPTLKAIYEYLKGELYYRYADKKESEQ